MKLILILLGFFNIFFCRCLKRNWYNPAILYTVVWTFFVVFTPVILWRDKNWSYTGLIWIEISCLMMIIGQGLAISFVKRNVTYNICKGRQCCDSKIKINEQVMKIIMIFMVCISLFYFLYNLAKKGFSFSSLFVLSNLLEVNDYSAYQRYSGELTTSLFGQILLVIEYTCPLLGGMMYNYFSTKKGKFLCIVTLIPVGLSMVTSNAKAGFIACVMFWIITFFLGYYIKNGYMKKPSLKTIIIFFVLFIIFLVLLFVSFCLRIGSFDMATLEVVKDKFEVYCFGQVKAFDEWFGMGRLKESGLDLGINTYMWVFNRLGLVMRQQGVYGLATSIHTNVYTWFRGLIADFGVFFGLVYCLCRGFVGGYFYEKIFNKKNISCLSLVVLCADYFFIFYGFIISPWIYTSYAMCFVLFAIIIYYCQEYKKLKFKLK